MSWHKGTATDYQDLVDVLEALCTENHIDTAAVNAGGTGYALGDLLTVVGGTATVTAVYEVWKLGVSAAAINAGGTGYTVSDVLTVVGGDGTAATLTVTSVSGGVIDGISVTTAGSYKTLPTNPVSVTGGTGSNATFNLTVDIVTDIRAVNQGAYTSNPSSPVSTTTDGAGSGCTLTVTFQSGNGWTTLRNDTVGDRELILRGDGSGSDEIFVGVRSYNISDSYNWEVAGFTGYSSGLDWENQPGISPGRYDNSENGAYVPLANVSIDYWFSINSNRIIGIFKIGSAYPNMYLGFLDPFGTSTEYPYPLYISGCTNDYDLKFSATEINYSGMSDPISQSSGYDDGPAFIYSPSGTWYQIANSYRSGTNRYAQRQRNVFPPGSLYGTTTGQTGSIPYAADDWYVDFAFYQFCPNTGIPGTASYQIRPTPDDDGDIPLFQCIVGACYPERIFYGEMIGVFWFSAAGSVVTEQTIEIGDDVYRIFQNCQRTEDWAFFAIKEQ